MRSITFAQTLFCACRGGYHPPTFSFLSNIIRASHPEPVELLDGGVCESMFRFAQLQVLILALPKSKHCTIPTKLLLLNVKTTKLQRRSRFAPFSTYHGVKRFDSVAAFCFIRYPLIISRHSAQDDLLGWRNGSMISSPTFFGGTKAPPYGFDIFLMSVRSITFAQTFLSLKNKDHRRLSVVLTTYFRVFTTS